MKIIEIVYLALLTLILLILIAFIFVGLYLYQLALYYINIWDGMVDEFNKKKDEFTDSIGNIKNGIDDLKKSVVIIELRTRKRF